MAEETAAVDHAMGAHAEVPAPAGEELHAGPAAFGLGPVAWVALSMLALLAIAFFGAKVHKLLAGGLDKGIAEIRKQLDEAKALRAEAEALRKEYADKIAGAEKDAAAMIENAQREASAIIARAETDTAEMIARRQKMADDKITAAELSALADLRAVAANAAAAASRSVIAGKHGQAEDRRLVDETIAGL